MPHGKYMTRRALGALGAGALAGGAIGATADGGPGGLQLPKEAATALNRLREGLDRFIKGSSKHAHADINWRKQLVNSQKPFATILGCCDSRVPVELLFDQGFGDLFAVAEDLMEFGPVIFLELAGLPGSPDAYLTLTDTQ